MTRGRTFIPHKHTDKRGHENLENPSNATSSILSIASAQDLIQIPL
jgi:hypothetical protein